MTPLRRMVLTGALHAMHAMRAVGGLALIAACGCEAPQSATTGAPSTSGSNSPDLVSETAASSPRTPHAVSMSEQSARDAQAILNARAAALRGTTDDLSQRDDLRTEPLGPRQVLWNDVYWQANAEPTASASRTATQARTASQSRAKPVGLESNSGNGEGEVGTRPTTPLPSAKRPLPALQPDRLKTLMIDLASELYAAGAYSDRPMRELLAIAAMSMVDPQRTLEPSALPNLKPAERELLSKLQVFFGELGSSVQQAGDVEQAIVQAVSALRASLVKQPQLRLANTLMCTRVNGFGDYVAVTRNSFLAHAEQRVIIYLEIENFASELDAKGEHVTQLAQQLTIYSDRDGIPVWKEDWQAAMDRSKNQRKDFFTVQVITFPKALSVGKYQLKVRVRDDKTQAEAEGSIPFEMVADPRLAAQGK